LKEKKLHKKPFSSSLLYSKTKIYENRKILRNANGRNFKFQTHVNIKELSIAIENHRFLLNMLPLEGCACFPSSICKKKQKNWFVTRVFFSMKLFCKLFWNYCQPDFSSTLAKKESQAEIVLNKPNQAISWCIETSFQFLSQVFQKIKINCDDYFSLI